jgi:hypothetical protein
MDLVAHVIIEADLKLRWETVELDASLIRPETVRTTPIVSLCEH